jgi:hypothetical protein
MTAVRLFAVVFAAALAAPASALATSPWQPFRAAPFDLPAGSRCSFPLSGRIVEDRERIRTTEVAADGSPAQQEVKGRLVVRYINQATNESIERDLTGTALIDFAPDGSFSFTLLRGSLAVGLGATDPRGPAFLVLSGRDFVVDFGADGSRTITDGTGSVENVCETLAS